MRKRKACVSGSSFCIALAGPTKALEQIQAQGHSLAHSLTHALTRCQGRLGAEHEAARGSAWGLCGWPLTATCFSVAKIMLRLIARCPLARNRAHPPLPHRSRRQGFVPWTQKGGEFLVPPTHVRPKRGGGSWSPPLMWDPLINFVYGHSQLQKRRFGMCIVPAPNHLP